MLKFILTSLLVTSSAGAIDFTVIGPCDEKPLVQVTVPASVTTLGDLTVDTLTSLAIPFIGERTGISSIAHSPQGEGALEVLSATQMRAYGWCVDVDGVQPDLMPDAVPVSATTKAITWFYAYSFYDAGEWKDYCSPSWKIRSLPICQK